MSYSDQTLALAQVSDLIAELLEVVLRGLEGAEHAFRDGEKQTMIWREELETCGEQQGSESKFVRSEERPTVWFRWTGVVLTPLVSHADVHADLFMLLMAGRANPAVTEWLGNRLTGRVRRDREGNSAQAHVELLRLSQSGSPQSIPHTGQSGSSWRNRSYQPWKGWYFCSKSCEVGEGREYRGLSREPAQGHRNQNASSTQLLISSLGL
jgi:hypothetical protein